MSFQEHAIKTEYRSLIDNVVQKFYVPLLKEAVSYKRAVGFFSSSSLIEISKGIADLASRGGRIQIVASPYLSDDDIEAIKKGYADRDEVIEAALLGQLSDEHTDYYSMERLNLLANLIANGVLDIRIAYTEDAKGIGMYHEKMGIIEDADGNKVAFSGSMNESSTAMSLNYETIDVFRSWYDEGESERVRLKENAFYSIWGDCEPSIRVLEFPKITDALIEKYRKKAPNFNIDQEQFPPRKENQRSFASHTETHGVVGARIPQNITLHDYQKQAISAWVGENYRGIFDMATGTGKTFTGLGAISKLSEDLNDELAVIIVCPYQHLVEQWVDDIVKFNIQPIIGYSSSSQKDWKKRLSKAVRDQKLRNEKRFFCFICTNATFANSFVQEQIGKIKSPVLLVVDEAHNFGARSYAKLLDERFTYRLALSATLERHRDEEGTATLYSFFGKKCIEYSLERAIEEEKLTPYKYYPVLVYLNDEELEKYEQLSFEISRHVIKSRGGKVKLDSYGEMLAIQRSRIVAAAALKLVRLKEVIAPYKDEHFLLDKNNQMIELYKAYTQRIYDELNAEYKQKEAQIRTKLQMYINEIFKSIYDGGLSLTIDEHYNISVYVTDFDGGVETSTAQSISVIFAFISAIIKMARENQLENGDEAYSEPYPLVMDAPLSAFDKRRIKAICSAIPETAEQVIIFIKDTDGELAEEHLGTKVRTRHYFEKIDEFHTRLV